MAKFCSKCGNELKEGARFCSVCGNPVKQVQSAQSEATAGTNEERQGVSSQQQGFTAQDMQYQQMAGSAAPVKKNKNLWLLAIPAAILVILLVIFGIKAVLSPAYLKPVKYMEKAFNKQDIDLMKKAVPIAVILCVILFIAMLCKTIICKTVVISPIFILVGFAFGFLLLIIHEWLHGIVYPKEADVTIGRIKGKATFVALASYPLRRDRFILMCLLPFVLGVVPFILFVISPAEFRVLNGLNFGMACMGMISPFPDVFNVLVVLRNSEKSDSIMFYKNDMYKIS